MANPFVLQKEKKNVNKPLFFFRSLFLCFFRWISFLMKFFCRLFSTSDRLETDKVFDRAPVL